MRRVPSQLVVALAAVAFVIGCGGGSPTTDSGVYRAKISSSPSPVHGLLLSVAGAKETPKLLLSSGVTGRVSAGSTGTWKVLLVGSIGSEPFLEISTGSGGAAPTLTVSDASGGRSDSYRSLSPSAVKIEVVKP